MHLVGRGNTYFSSLLVDTKAWTLHPLPGEYAGSTVMSPQDGRD